MSPLSPQLIDTLASSSPRILVIGDLMLDGWLTGAAERMTREAPAPVVQITERSFAGGGAANTALNLAALGADVAIIGIIGADSAGEKLQQILQDAGVDTSGIVVVPQTSTTAKNRILSAGHIFVRIDEINNDAYPKAALAEVVRRAEQHSNWAQVEVICDYGCGLLTREVVHSLAGRAVRAPLRIVDAHDPAAMAPLRPDLVTPNAEEFAALCGPLPQEGRFDAVIENRQRVLERTGAHAVIATLDKDGSVLLSAEGVGPRTHAEPAAERNTSGAGDTYTAAIAMARAAELPWELSLELAQLAANIVVRRPGTAVCTAEDLRRELSGSGSPMSWEGLQGAIAAHRQRGERIVFTNGCFDVVHTGHIASLRQASRLGDVLVVAVNDDESATLLKGLGRPVNTVADRVAVLCALSPVDYVAVFGGRTPAALIELLRPEVYAKGGNDLLAAQEEIAAVRAYGGRVEALEYVADHSTTSLVDQIRDGRPASSPRRSA